MFLKDITKLTINIWSLKTYYILSKHIIYLDADNLYGYAMSEFLPASRL